MKKSLILVFLILLASILLFSACSKSATVPAEVIDSLITERYENNNGMGGTCKVATTYQCTHNTIEKNKDIVTIDATVTSEICTKKVVLECTYVLDQDEWRVENMEENIISTEWHYDNIIGYLWTGGAGLNYRAFKITNVYQNEKMMDIVDMNGREYTTSYEISKQEIIVKVKYDVASWSIKQEGPSFKGYYMSK